MMINVIMLSSLNVYIATFNIKITSDITELNMNIKTITFYNN